MQAITIGGAIIDIIVSGVKAKNGGGSKENVEAITLGIGGGAVNASFALRTAGLDTGIVCALGDDKEAKWIRAVLEREHIDLSQVQSVTTHPTGKAVVLLDKQGEARVYAQRGASTQVCAWRAPSISDADLLYVTALSAQAETDLAQALGQNKPLTPRLVINPGMAQLETLSAAFSQLLVRADLVCLNESESRMLARQRGLTLPDDMRSAPAALLARLSAHTKQALLITLGEHGALFYDPAGLHFSRPAHVAVCSTLGAGDAFCATFASHWVRAQPVPAALTAAQAYCAQVLQSLTANLVKV